MKSEDKYLIAVQALYDHSITVIDACPEQTQEDLSVIRNVSEILFSHVQELLEREEN